MAASLRSTRSVAKAVLLEPHGPNGSSALRAHSSEKTRVLTFLFGEAACAKIALVGRSRSLVFKGGMAEDNLKLT
jgi:hypothetical protein